MVVPHRDVSPLLQAFRNFLLGRKHTIALRFQDKISPRTQPPPNLPDGPASALHDNRYYERDARRLSQPPLLVAVGIDKAKALSPGSAVSETQAGKPRLPGKQFLWRASPDSKEPIG